MAKDPQINLAETLGYVESVGDYDRGVRRGDLVPYDDPSSPLSFEQQDELKRKGFPPGRIRP